MSNIDKLKPGKYAILFRNNWDGEGDNYETFAILDAEGIWRDEDGGELLEYQGDEVLSAWPMDDGSNVLALLDELEAAEKRVAELELRLSQQQSIAANNLDMFRRADARVSELEARELVVNLPAYVDGRTLGYGEVNHMIDLCADAIEKAGHTAGIITKVGE